MENTDNTLLEMQRQMQHLKEKLEKEKIVNETLLRKSCRQSISRLRFKSNIPIFFAAIAILASPSFLELGMSLSFVIFTSVLMVFCIIATILINRNIPDMDKDLVTAAGQVRRFRKLNADWIKIGLPLLAVWIGCVIWEAVKGLTLTGAELYGFIAGIGTGLLAGVIIGLKLRRDLLDAADELVDQLCELKESE